LTRASTRGRGQQGSPGRRLMKLSADRPLGEGRRVDVEVVDRGIADNLADPLRGSGDTARRLAVGPREVLTVKEINPVRTLAASPGGVQVKGGDLTPQTRPIDSEAGFLLLRDKVERGRTPPTGIAAPRDLPSRQRDHEVSILILIHQGDLMCRRRGRPGAN